MLASSGRLPSGSLHRSHPRRRPADRSVSLRHDGPVPAGEAAEAPFGTVGSPTLRATMRQPSDDSGEGAEKWFDQANKRPGKGLGFPRVDDDEPPYFLPRNSSDNSNAASVTMSRLHGGHITSQPQELPQHSVIGGSTVGDYRSVIDDLTIENQKLKQELRKLKKSNETHLPKDRLLEVRIHAPLSARKRRQLEEVLGSFASSVDDSSEKFAAPSRPSKATNSSGDMTKNFVAKNSSSSNTSSSRLPDSAYASIANSGPTSLFAPTNRHGLERKKPRQPLVKTDQNIRSFLHNIPEGLLPKHFSGITERQKKKLVVQRLEELFTGSQGIMVGDHSQPLQQQEVSASAAKADQDANQGVAPLEGLREANMCPHAMDIDSGKLKDAELAGNGNSMEASVSDASEDRSPCDSSPGQRPTRPLDLDPDRAQIASENIDYIRHLGLSTPKFRSEASSESAAANAADADGWIYLNLLVSMAQLHIINVTPDFVREALLDVSERFQVSSDGKKVRWRGGMQGTRMSSHDDTSTAVTQTSEDSDSLDEPNRKRRKVDAGKFAPVPVDADLSRDKLAQSFHYKPLFKHSESSGGSISSEEYDSLFGYNAKNEGRTENESPAPRIWQRGSASRRSAKEKQDAGLLVYYQGAQFCTDLSGDRGRSLTPVHVSAADQDGYFDGQQGALGDSSGSELPQIERTPSGSLLPFRPFKDYSKGASILGVGDPRPTTPELLDEQTDDDLFIHVSARGTAPLNRQQAFDSTGLGGTRPADHFVMKVVTRRITRDGYHPHNSSRFAASGFGQNKFAHRVPRFSPPFIMEPGMEADEAGLTSVSQSTGASTMQNFPIRTEILSSQITQLEPSALPPPLGYYSASSSSDVESNCSDSSSHSSHLQLKSNHVRMTDTLPGPLDHPPWAQGNADGEVSDGGNTSDCDDDDDGDSSIDMLAEARKLDPETVAAQEKEFDMGIDDKSTSYGGVRVYSKDEHDW